jgi:hypothetical protein
MTITRLILAAVLLTLLPPSDSFSQLVPPPRIEPNGPPLFVVTVNGQDGFIDRDGEIVIEPAFEKAYPFTDGLAAVQEKGLWGFIDTKGRMIIEPRFIMVGLFSDGLASFRDRRLTDPWGYIDKSGNVVIEPQFDAAGDFRNGVARVGFATLKGKLISRIADVGVECDYKFIDRTGKIVPEPSPVHYATGEPGELIPFRKDDVAGYLNAHGEVVIQPQFQLASAFSEGLACVCKEGLFGYIDTRGKWVIPPRFQYANDFSDGLAGVAFGENGWGFIDHAGKEVIPGKFAWVHGGFRQGVAEVAFDHKRGYINKKGDWVWRPSE